MGQIVRFDDPQAAEHALSGGKGANLGRLTAGGFAVPPGFVITTGAYRDFLQASGLADKIRAILSQLNIADAAALEESAAAIRRLIVETPLGAALEKDIAAAYAALGDAPYVAVRSSGSAEDLAEASFAGLHDTYLDIKGADDVLDAVRRCWASLWTARAVSYRQTKGFDHLSVAIAVVVQTMVESEVSGVLFTANPMNTANDELVINSSWGLGEAIVGGITTPDEFTVKAKTGRIIDKKLGGKAVQVIRSPSGRGTISGPVPDGMRNRFSLSDEHAAELAVLGERIEAFYDGAPQDIEWARADGQFYILQARPITGVEFSWDCDVNACVPGAEVPDDELWGRALADEGWAGACTPLMFSWRGLTMVWGHSRVVDIAGYPHLGNDTRKLWHFCKGKAYYNVLQDRAFIEELTPPPFRNYIINRMPKDARDDVRAAPFDIMKYINMYVRYHTIAPDQGLPWIMLTKRFETSVHAAEHDGLSPEQLRALSDQELKAYIHRLFELEWEFGDAIWPGMVLFMRDVTCLMDQIVAHFYTGDDPNIRADLQAGAPRRGATARENVDLYNIAVQIRASKTLKALFDKAEKPDDFFGKLDASKDGRAFKDAYAIFIQRHGHRGHSDRDLYFLRRAENPSVDFLSLKALLSANPLADPAVMEEKVNQRREEACAKVIENLAAQPFGGLKVEVFKLAHEYVMECTVARDEERHFHDRASLSTKRGYLEINRRLVERGVLTSERDCFFLTQDELYALLDGAAMTPLIRAKIDGRMRDFDRVNDKVVPVPLFLKRGLPSSIDKADYGDGALHGTATSRGVVTGTARVIKSLSEIPRVREGEILVVNATDPGWTPVFMLIKGIVLETGGMLAHGSLLAREYGFPAVQVEDAMLYIPDGATITVDGDNGVVTILEAPDLAAE